MSQQEPEWLRQAREKGLKISVATVNQGMLLSSPSKTPDLQEKITAMSTEDLEAAIAETGTGADSCWSSAQSLVAGELDRRRAVDRPTGNASTSGCPFPPVREDEFQRQVIELAHLHGWKVAHFRSVPVKHGDRVVYQTPVQADGRGFPDLVLVRDRVIFAELKTDYGKVSESQVAWAKFLDKAGGDYCLWRPRDWDEIEAVLSGRPLS